MSSSSYYYPVNSAESKLTEKGSRFLGYAAPASDEAAALEILSQRRKKYYNATHNCWAFRVGDPSDPLERYSDDGEPHFTAGKPILEQIKKLEPIGIIVIVTRWFGGTKLGRGGLIRAYGGCAAETLRQIYMKSRIPKSQFVVQCEYDAIGIVEHAVSAFSGEVKSGKYERSVELTVSVPSESADLLRQKLIDVGNGRIGIESER